MSIWAGVFLIIAATSALLGLTQVALIAKETAWVVFVTSLVAALAVMMLSQKPAS